MRNKAIYLDRDNLDFFKHHLMSFDDAFKSGFSRGLCARIIDGDTQVFYVDLPFRNIDTISIRLTHKIGEQFNCYETRGKYSHEIGHAAKEWCKKHLLGKPVLIKSGKETFNRWVGEIYFIWEGELKNLALLLRELGFENPEPYKK